MELAQAFADKEVRQLLVGEEADLAEAFTLVDAHLRKRFAKGARNRLPGIRPEDLADAWQETLRDLLKAVRTGGFDPDRELCPWLWTIFIRRVFDSIRRKDSYEGMLNRVKEQLSQTMVGGRIGALGEDERTHLLDHVRQAVGTLPVRQRTVIQTFVDYFPATQDLDALRRLVSELTGLHETRAAVVRALQEARRKIAGLLKTRHL